MRGEPQSPISDSIFEAPASSGANEGTRPLYRAPSACAPKGTSMAESCKSCPCCVDRRSLLRGTAAYAVAAAFAAGCTTSEPIDTTGNAHGGGSGEGGVSSAGSGGQLDTGGGGAGSGSGGQGGASGGAGGGDAGAASGSGGMAGRNAAAGSGGGGGGGANGNPQADAGSVDAGATAVCPGATAVGKAASVAMGSLVSAGYGLVVGRDSGGLYAMSSICTHQGCGMNIVSPVTQPSLHCPCHGSNFSASGAVTRGPARVPLQHFQLLVSASGDVTVCSNVAVSSAMRTPV
jgi:Rieske Fe-S protein